MGEHAPWSPAAFEQRYASDADPWSFATSTYELDRYASILDALRPEPYRYRFGYEPACSVGVLTTLLAPRCDTLVATDVSPSAVGQARKRCGLRTGLSVEVGSVQDGPPGDDGPDLVVFSELGYYFTELELAAIVGRIGRRMAPGGDLVACHWTGESADHQLGAATVHDVLGRTLAPIALSMGGEVHDGFLLDAWRLS